MRHLPALLAVLLFAGCAHTLSTPSPQVLRDIPARMHLLRQDMTTRERQQALGLRPKNLEEEQGGGPTNRYWTSYSVGGGHSYVEWWDHTTQPPRLLMVQFDGFVWTPSTPPRAPETPPRP